MPLRMADLTRSRFSEKAFAVMDKDGSGEVDFLEFVLAVWNYCSFTHSSLVRFAFDLYDLDGSGEIEREEAAQCIREVWGSEWESSNIAQKILAKLESIMQNTASGRLNVNLFQDFAARHPMLLFPAFQLQTEIQQKILGQRFWAQAAKRRGTLDPKDFNWGTVEKVAKLSRANSRNLLQAMESDLGEQLEEHLQMKKTGKSRPKNALKRFSGSFSPTSSVGASISQDGGEVISSDAVSAITTFKTAGDPLRPTKRKKRSKPSIRSSAKSPDRRESGQLVVEDMER